MFESPNYAEKPTLLLIDDESAPRIKVARELRNRGYDVIDSDCGENVEDAVTKNASTLQACILDLTLQRGRRSGIETLRAIRSVDPGLPVLIFTGHDAKHREDAARAGATLFMSKPYKPEYFFAAIDCLVQMQLLRRNVIATETELQFLRRAVDAVGVGIMISDDYGKVLLSNETRHHWNATSPTSLTHGSGWKEIKEGDRWLWRQVSRIESTSRPTLCVTTELEVTRWKIMDKIREALMRGASAFNRPKLVEAAADWLHRDLGFARVRIWLNDGDIMVGSASRGMNPGTFEIGEVLDMQDGFTRNAIQKRTPHLLRAPEDFHNDPCFKRFEKHGIRTQLQVPLAAGGLVLGLISIDDVGSRRALTLEDIELMKVFSILIGDAMNVADDNADRDRRAAWAHALNKIDEPLTAGSRLDQVCAVVGKTLAEIVGADKGVVFIREEPGFGLKIVTVIEQGDQSLLGVEHDGHGMIGECMSTREVVFEKDVWKRPGFKDCFTVLESVEWRGFLNNAKSVVVVPLLCGTAVMGVLFLRSSMEMDIDDVDKRYLSAVASRVSIALAKLDEFQRVEASLVQQSMLHDIGHLAAGAAHGVRNPLATVQWALANLEAELETGAGAIRQSVLAQKINLIHSSIDGAIATLERLTEWCKPQGLEPVPFQLSQLVRELIAIVHADMEHRRITVLDGELRECLPLVCGSKDQLRMALADLFWNAARAMPKGGTLRISYRLSQDGKYVELQIADTGEGMSDEMIHKLLNHLPFRPIPAGGPGLGFYLCKKIIAAHDGNIQVHSRVGEGTVVTIKLPHIEAAQIGKHHD
jgi:signal transduction histidine kinase/CheY-like chemotaxis protein